MRLFDILSLSSAAPLLPIQYKIHLASWNGWEDPLRVFLEGRFDDWQSWQTRKNFERDYILSLVNLPQPNKWLFAGVYRQTGCRPPEAGSNLYRYETELLDEFADLIGRLVVIFSRPGRSSYLKAERWADSLLVSELREARMTIEAFPGFNRTLIMKSTLDVIVREQIPSWKSALANVAGIYLITDTMTGKHYVGSASGLGGIWERWSNYSYSGHGGNVELTRLLREQGADYAKHFQFSILEIADTHASQEDILTRESHWKEVLRTRQFGYNEN